MDPGRRFSTDGIVLLLGASLVTHLDDHHENPVAYCEGEHVEGTCMFCKVLAQSGGVKTLGGSP